MNVNSLFLNTDVSSVKTAASTQAAAGSSFNEALQQAVSSSRQTEQMTMETVFERASETYGVPLNLLKAVAKAESNFNPNAVSSCGAQGVMQLMPSTAASLGVTDSFNAEQNIMGGAKMLGGLLKQYNGSEELALAAYNAGSGNVDKYGGVPPFKETQNYIKKVMEYVGGSISVPATTVSSLNATSVPQTASLSKSGSLQMLQLLAEQMKFNAMNAVYNTQSQNDSVGIDEQLSSLTGGTSSLYETTENTLDSDTILQMLKSILSLNALTSEDAAQTTGSGVGLL